MIDQVFEPKLAAAMRFALDEACRNLPARYNDHDCRCFVATKIIERARSGEKTLDSLVSAGRAAVAEMITLHGRQAA
jgi:urease gamma subunit